MLAGTASRLYLLRWAHCRKLGLQTLQQTNWLQSLSGSSPSPNSLLSFAGTPALPSFEDNPVLDNIHGHLCSVHHLLGEGASG